MKHTKKRLLAALLVLAMAIGMVPFGVLTAGAESAIVEAIVLNDEQVITDLEWITAYVASPYNKEGKAAGQVVKKWSGAYRLSEIVIVPKAGTTLVWNDPVSAGALDEGQYFLTSWKSVGENEWELDATGTNLVAAGLTSNINQIYDSVNQTVMYMYTTTSDNEALRFASYGAKADGEFTDSADECPAVYAYDTTFAEGTISNVRWDLGAVVPKGFGGVYDRAVEGYVTSYPIAIPKAGTTISLNGVCDENVFAVSVWRASENGTLELVYGCAGSEENNAWTTVTPPAQEGDDPLYTYAYTSSYDNEIIRISGAATSSAPVISYVENNAANHAPILKAAGYDPAQSGTPYMLKWYDGAISVEGKGLVFGSEDYAYSFSDVLPIYKAGTQVTFTDVVTGDNATATDFATDAVYTVARFNGADYEDLDAVNVTEFLAGVMVGDNANDRAIALKNGKRVYTYTTTEATEYLRLSYCRMGNKVNGSVVNPIIYISAPGEGIYYDALQGLTVYSVAAQSNAYWGDTNVNETWASALSTRYGWNYVDVDKSANVSDANVLLYHTVGAESAADIAAMMEEETLLVVITDDATLSAELKAAHGDAICVICVYEDLPYRRYPDYTLYDAAYAGLYMNDTNLNAAGHALIAPWIEQIVSEHYLNFGGATQENGPVLKFMNGDNVVAMIGTASGERAFKVPGVPGGVYAASMFGWVGMLKTADGNETVRVFAAGEEVTAPQNARGEFRPLYMDMEQGDEPALHVNDTTAGLIFLSAVNEAHYQNVLTMIGEGKLGNATVTLGMLIVPYQYVVDMGGELTHASLAEAELQGVDVTADVKEVETGASTRYMESLLDDIKSSDCFKKFTARGYAKLTVDGVDYYAYAENDGAKATTIYEKAIVALNDCYPRPKDGYLNQVAENVYSPYTVAQRAVLAKYAKGVIELETVRDSATNMQTAQLVHGEYYDVNAKRKVFTVVGGNGSDTMTDIFYDYSDDTRKTFMAADAAWAELLAALGADPMQVDSICVVKVRNGDEASAIMLDGFMLDIGDPAALCVEYTYNGDTCYLIGFSNYTPFY